MLFLLVGAVLWLSHLPQAEPVFRWLPVPLWCYMLPMIAVTLGWLPRESASFRMLNDLLLPFALGLLLLGIDLPSVLQIGWRALAATAIGSAGIIFGAPLVGWLLRARLTVDAWKGLGTLAATWTGGSMNLLALRTIVQTPTQIFASLIIVDALIAYGWMALLVSLSSCQAPLDRWLRAIPLELPATPATSTSESSQNVWLTILGVVIALGLGVGASLLSRVLPLTSWVNSRQGWTVLLVTTSALAASFLPSIQRVGRTTSSVGYPCLYLVLAAVGAQANLSALQAVPIWIVAGVGIALVHGIFMLIGGRLLRLPLGVLATASQANLGGVVSTPLVGAVYEHRLAPVGLLLAIGLNAVGTYLGLISATLCRWLLKS